MKRAILSCVIASGFMFSTQAFAETAAVDLFVGDFMGVATVDVAKLAANSMIDKAIGDNAKHDDVQDVLKALSDLGIDYKKDIGVISAASDEDGDFCLVIDAKKSLVEVVKKYVEKEKSSTTVADHKGVAVYTMRDSGRAALVSDKRLIACDDDIDILPIIDNAKAEKPKLLKDRDGDLYKAYSATSKSADVRVGAKLTGDLRKSFGHYSIDDGAGKKVSVDDIQSASLSFDFSKGLKAEAIAHSKSPDKAKMGADILTKQVVGLLSDPAMDQLGLGFLKNAVKFTADKSSLKGVVTLTNDQITQLSMLFMELTAPTASVPAQRAAAPTPKAAPATSK